MCCDYSDSQNLVNCRLQRTLTEKQMKLKSKQTLAHVHFHFLLSPAKVKPPPGILSGFAAVFACRPMLRLKAINTSGAPAQVFSLSLRAWVCTERV